MKKMKSTSTVILILLFSIKGMSQQPGGVSGTKVWYITTQDNLTGKYNYIDYSGNKWDPVNLSGSPRNINFQSATLLTKQTNITLANLDLSQLHLFFPVYLDASKMHSDFLFMNLDDGNNVSQIYPSSLDTNDQNLLNYEQVQNRNTLLVKEPVNPRGKSFKIFDYYKSSPKVNYSIWPETVNSNINIMNIGYLPEIIVYNRVLTELERLKIASYLAIKYGITLDTSYCNRHGGILWDVNKLPYKKYSSRIFAIGKDSLAAIHQKKSNSSYEETEKYYSYEHDSKFLTIPPFDFVPVSDSASLYRSLTIGFCDTSMNAVPDETYFFCGDDSGSVHRKDYRNMLNNSNIKIVKRKWLIKNINNVKEPIKIIISGFATDEENESLLSTLYGSLYFPYDFQKYRYGLVKFKENATDPDTTILNSYFGRQISKKQDFHTRTIIWDSIQWNNNDNYFSFSKIPLLNIIQILHDSVKSKDKKKPAVCLPYPYYVDSAITQSVIYKDTLVLSYKDTSHLYLTVRTTCGIFPIKCVISEIGNQLNTVSYRFDKGGSKSGADSLSGIETESVVVDFDKSESNYSCTKPEWKQKSMDYFNRFHKTSNLSVLDIDLSKKFNVKTGKRYLIEISDAMNQYTSLPIVTILETNPPKK